MNYQVELTKIQKVLKEFIPHLKTTIIGQQVEATNIVSIMKELKRINYRIDRLRSDLKLMKEKKIDVSETVGIDNGCKESNQ